MMVAGRVKMTLGSEGRESFVIASNLFRVIAHKKNTHRKYLLLSLFFLYCTVSYSSQYSLYATLISSLLMMMMII